MTLEVLAHEALGNQERKSYVSAVERGKKKLSPLTIQKFAKALDLPDSLVDPLLQDDVTEDEPTTQTERDADRLFDELTVLRNELKLSESLALALAYEYAEGNPSDLQSALRELKRAFELASRHAPGGNLDSDLSAIMAEVDHLNEEESIEAGSATLRKAMATRRGRAHRRGGGRQFYCGAGLRCRVPQHGQQLRGPVLAFTKAAGLDLRYHCQ